MLIDKDTDAGRMGDDDACSLSLSLSYTLLFLSSNYSYPLSPFYLRSNVYH